MRQLFKRMTALLCSGLLLTGLCVTENNAAENRKTYTVIIVVCAPQCYNEMNKNGT